MVGCSIITDPATTPTLQPISTTQHASAASGLSPEELEHAREYMLALINQARRNAGLNEVALGDNTAAQMHAEDMRKNCFFAYWGSDGTKPYMRYTLAGGTQYSRYIINGANYCPSDPDKYTKQSLEADVKETMDGLMNSSGNRRNVLSPHNTKVNLGFSYSRPNLWVVQEYETDYIEFDEVPTIKDDGKLSFSASVKNGAVVKEQALLGTTRQRLGVHIFYDPPLRKLTRGQLARTYCYSTGKRQLASLRKPLTYGVYFTSQLSSKSDGCVDPYKIDLDSATANSYEHSSKLHDEALQASRGRSLSYYLYQQITADQWDTSETDFSVSADIKRLLLNNGEGVYTILIYGGGNPLSNYSIFVSESDIPE